VNPFDPGAHLILRWRPSQLDASDRRRLQQIANAIEDMGVSVHICRTPGAITLLASGPTQILELLVNDVRAAGHPVREEVTAEA
jgi:hypothetical protein